MSLTAQTDENSVLTDWTRERNLKPNVKNLMGFLVLSELAGDVKALPTGTRFLKEAGRIDLDKLHDAAIAVLKASRKRRSAKILTGESA